MSRQKPKAKERTAEGASEVGPGASQSSAPSASTPSSAPTSSPSPGPAIRVLGARAHNLAGIDVEIPHGALTVITGPSGSGKSSLAFDVVHAEAERRFLAAHGEGHALAPAAVDDISGLLPALAVRQTPPRLGPRATVATLANLAEPLRVLFYRLSVLACPRCGETLQPLARAEIVDRLVALPEGSRLTLSAPLDDVAWRERPSMAQLREALDELHRRGYARLLVAGRTVDLEPRPALGSGQGATLDLLVDRVVVREGSRGRIAESVELALREGQGVCRVTLASADRDAPPGPGTLYTDRSRCVHCALELPPLDVRTFTHTSPEGACPDCHGTGEVLAIDPDAVVPDPSLSLEDGAIAPFGEPGSARHKKQIAALRDALDVPLSVPFGELPRELAHAILHGGVPPSREGTRKGKKAVATSFEGVVPLLTRRLVELTRRAELGARPDEEEAVWASLEDELGAFRATTTCPTCAGTRLGVVARTARLFGATLPELLALDAPALLERVRAFPQGGSLLLSPLVRALTERLELLARVGLGYLVVDRSATTLSAGEAQRIRLAEVLGSSLSHLLYVLDEPSQGLHPRDVASVIAALGSLRARQGTLLVVEHELSVIEAADRVIELGPGAGTAGGRLVAVGTPAELRTKDTLTARYLVARPAGPDSGRSVRVARGTLELREASLHNLRGVSASFVRRGLNVVAGVSGSGKSSLLSCVEALARKEIVGTRPRGRLEPLGTLTGLGSPNAGGVLRVLSLDESPMGRSARSTPATFLNVLSALRELFVQLPDAKARGWDSARFSFNVGGSGPSGRCERCEGNGVLEVKVLGSALEIACPLCHGSRYERETLSVRWRGMSIADVLALSIDDALKHFESIPALVRRLAPARRVGLGYLSLGQRASTLSGGEAQRLALARELGQGGAGETLYLLDEPTRGLHLADVDALTDVLEALVDEGHTVIVAAHALALVRAADRVIELGPGGGPEGGQIVFSGLASDLREMATATGEALRAR
jgi:excinuclease ABC subunit A